MSRTIVSQPHLQTQYDFSTGGVERSDFETPRFSERLWEACLTLLSPTPYHESFHVEFFYSHQKRRLTEF
jgi:hypothetical protein